jgi:hypothetical protein
MIALSKKGHFSLYRNIIVFDDTGEATLTLWNVASETALTWKPSWTILLMSRPGWRFDKGNWLSMTPSTRIEVDPDMADTDWLRQFAQRLTRRDSVNQPFPNGGNLKSRICEIALNSSRVSVFDMQTISESSQRILFTLADVDEW